VVRDQSFLARDLLRGGKPVRVSEKSGTHSLKQWDRIAARVVQVGARFEMAGGGLGFTHELGGGARAHFAELRKAVRSEIGKLPKPPGSRLDTEILRLNANLFTTIWLDDALTRALHPNLPKLINSDGDDIEPTTVLYPLKEPVDRQVIEEALAA